jgi:hypothetical protein
MAFPGRGDWSGISDVMRCRRAWPVVPLHNLGRIVTG